GEDLSEQIYLNLRMILKEVKGLVREAKVQGEEERKFYKNMNNLIEQNKAMEREGQELEKEHERVLKEWTKSEKGVQDAQADLGKQLAREEELTKKARKAQERFKVVDDKLTEKKFEKIALDKRISRNPWNPLAVFVLVFAVCLVLEVLALWLYVGNRDGSLNSISSLRGREPSTRIEGGLPARPAKGWWVLSLRELLRERILERGAVRMPRAV
ncbi:hypothetical protein HK097_003379, partial [Rhizophlyctis rosea]